MKAIKYDDSQVSNFSTGEEALTGRYDLLAANDMSWDCAVFADWINEDFVLMKLDLSGPTFDTALPNPT